MRIVFDQVSSLQRMGYYTCQAPSLVLVIYIYMVQKQQKKEAGDETVHLIDMYSRKETETNVIVFAEFHLNSATAELAT